MKKEHLIEIQAILLSIVALYFAFGLVYDLPARDFVAGGAVFILAGISWLYLAIEPSYDGNAVVEVDGGGMRNVTLEIKGDPITLLENQNEMRFKIQRSSDEAT